MFKLENYSRIEIIFEFVRKLYSYLKKIVSNEKKITRLNGGFFRDPSFIGL